MIAIPDSDGTGSSESLPPPTLFGLFSIAFRTGIFSFGGGISAWLHREFVLVRPWISEGEFMARMTTAQILPGANVTNLTVMIGMRLFGLRGAAVALFGLLIGPFFGVIGILQVIDILQGWWGMKPLLAGVTAGAGGLLIAMACRSGQQFVTRLPLLVVMLSTFILVGILRLPLVPVVLGLIPISIGAALWAKK